MSCDENIRPTMSNSSVSTMTSASLEKLKKPVVAIDVDEVLAQFVEGMIKFHNSKHGTSLALSDFFSYKFCEVWGGSDEEAMKKCFEFFDSDHFKNLAPVPGAAEVLHRLKGKMDFVVVTSRQRCIAEETHKFLEKHFPGVFAVALFGNIWVPNPNEPKASKKQMCESIGAIALVDDNPSYIRDVASVVRKPILFDYHDSYGWSKQGALPDNACKCTTWKEVEQELNDLYVSVMAEKLIAHEYLLLNGQLVSGVEAAEILRGADPNKVLEFALPGYDFAAGSAPLSPCSNAAPLPDEFAPVSG